MKEQQRIPTTKVERATQFVKTGLKVGANYVKHYARKTIEPDLDRSLLHEDNAEDIYNTLSQLKGSALKVAQMMSMDRNLLPREYVSKFQMSQYSAPPLSAPLVKSTFVKHLGKAPEGLYDQFDYKASNAASIGQVHRAVKGGKQLAVKIQYPGVAESISSDLKMVKPFAVRLMRISEADIERYMIEVEQRLIEETDYELELRRGQEISQACAHLSDLYFPQYYKELSSRRILTMDWIDGLHLDEFMATNPSQEVRNRVGQALWDFYDFQIHQLRQVHADPHPGNFLFNAEGRVGVIDFGCVKEIPEPFYRLYFKLIRPTEGWNQQEYDRLFHELQFLYDSDSEQEKRFFSQVFFEMAELLGEPFHAGQFNFGNEEYFDRVYAYGADLATRKEIRESRVARGAKDSLYINRTYYGLYSLLNMLKANISTRSIYNVQEA